MSGPIYVFAKVVYVKEEDFDGDLAEPYIKLIKGLL